MSQLKEEVRLQYEKLHQLLDEDLRQTVEVLDKAQAKFCSENAAQALHLGERMQEAKKLLGSLQLLFDKTEDVSFMKVGLGTTLCSCPQLLPGSRLTSLSLGSHFVHLLFLVWGPQASHRSLSLYLYQATILNLLFQIFFKLQKLNNTKFGTSFNGEYWVELTWAVRGLSVFHMVKKI